ncbi:MAG TPA: ABC transporter ATP-binding protein [Terriglobales bacterium]|nr:ABC transporter ATP-binding protein [Terriglobales bacterium]
MDTVVEARKLSKEYIRDADRVVALKDVDLEISGGEFLALMGPSGSGKSTLLHLIAAMDRPTSGQVLVLGKDPHSLAGRALARWRNVHIGFVFQSFNLIPVLTALENVALPLKLTSLSAKEQMEHATTVLSLVGLGDRLHHFPRQLSGGQEQRVAIARAIVTDPDFILADEPTGNLDAASANEILELLAALNRDHDKTIVMVTHDPHAVRFAKAVRYLEKGVLRPAGEQPEDWVDRNISVVSAPSAKNSSEALL